MASERAISLRIAVKDLEQARARLASLGVEGEAALNKIERGAPRAAAGLDQVGLAGQRAGGSLRGGLGNAAAQVQDLVVSLQAGQDPLRVLIQQGSQFASAFGPVGVIIGTIGAGVGALAGVLIGLTDSTEDAGEAAERATETYTQLHKIMEELRGSAELTGDALGASARNIVGIAEQRVATIETRIREARLEAERLAQTADPETAFLAQPADLEGLEEQLSGARSELTQLRAEAGEFAGEAAAAAQAASKLASGTILSAKERAEAEKEAEKEIAEALSRSGKQYEELAGISRTVIRQANQDRYRELQESLRDEERAVEQALRRRGQQYEELAGIAQTFIRQANQDRFQEQQREEREREQAAERLTREAEREQERLADQAARDLARPFETAQQNIQNSFTGTFETIYSGGVTSFEDLAGEVSRIFTRLAAELTTLLIFQPQLLTGGGGIGGAGSSLASQLGFASAGAAGVGSVGVANLAAGTPTSTPVTGPGGMLVGGGVTSSAGAAAAAGGFSSPRHARRWLGWRRCRHSRWRIGRRQPGRLASRQHGRCHRRWRIGTAIPIIGQAIGAFAGGALGGLIGGFFGGGNGSPGSSNDKGDLRFSTVRGSGGPFGRVAIGGGDAFIAALGPMIQQFDEGVAEFLTTRQEDAVGRALQSLEEFSGRFPESDPSKGFQAIIEQRTRTVLQTGFPGISADAVLEGATGVEDIARRLQTALETQQQINELTGPQGAGAELNRQLAEISEGFDELRVNAELYGIAIDGLTAAERRAIQAAKDAAKDPVRDQIFALTHGNTPAGRLAIELRQIDDTFDDLRKTAKELGISTKGLTEAEKEAKQAAREQAEAIKEAAREEEKLARQREEEARQRAREAREQARQQRQALALSVPASFDALADPLTALRTQIRFENKNPTQQFEAARKDFERLVRQSEQGNLEAIAALPGAAQLFRDLAGRFGSSPLQAEVDKQILRSVADVLSTVKDAQREASRGMVGAINRAERAIVDTLHELIAESRETRREIKRLGREARVA